MRLLDLQIIGSEVALKWDDGSESYLPIERLRRACPCAGCQGETDILGNTYKNPEQSLGPKAFQLLRIGTVGGYAIQPFWADGHNSGIFSFDYLRQIMPPNAS